MSIFSIVNSFDEAWKAVILPGRQEYTVSDLGPTDFSVQGNRIQRTDFRLLNKRGHIIECSFFQHAEIEDPIPCVVYLHANGCCRLEALQYSDLVLSNRISLFCFDFSGSGKSDGLYSSVGWYEQEDLECIIQYLYQTGRVSKVAVWGRSMGAITTILYAEKDPRINCIILDSPFSNFKKLVKETAKNKASIPGFLSNGAFSLIRKTILNKANFDIDHLRPIKYVEKIKIPALFGAAKDDSFVVPQHTKDLYYAYGGQKQLVIFDGDHNTERPYTWLLEVKEFLAKHLLTEDADGPQPIIKSFKTYFGTGENSQDNNNKSFSGAQKVNDHPLKKGALSPQDSLQDHKPMTFTWLEHSASTPNLPSMDEIFKNENSSDRLTKEVNKVHSKDATHLNKQHSTPYPHTQKTYTIEPTKNQQKSTKPELRKAVTVQFNLQEGSKTSRLPLKEYLDHSNTQSFPTLPEYSYKSNSPNSAAYTDLGKLKATNHAHYPSPYQNDIKKTNITLKEKVASAPSQNPLQNYKPSVYTIQPTQYKSQKTAPELPNSYSTSSLNSLYQPKLQHSETLPSLTFTSQTHSLNELPSESNRTHGVLTTRQSGEIDSNSSTRTATSNKSFTSIVEHERYYKENVSPALQRRKPLTYQINLNSSVPIINPNESNPNYGFLDVNKGGAFNNENRRASENVSNLLKKLITPQSGDFGANYHHQTGKTHYK